MKRLFGLVLAFLSILTFSCKKSSDDAAPSAQADYYQLKVGNYWIYQRYEIDTNGVVTPKNDFDSAYIEKDTIIRGSTYYKLWIKFTGCTGDQYPSYLRDSSAFLVNHLGRKECSVDHFNDTLYIDTSYTKVFRGYGLMSGMDSLVTVQAGTFPSITSRLQVVPTQPNDPHPVRYAYTIYGKSIGMIKSHSFFYMGGLQIESRLVRYKVQ
jgi:hypothetical protein